MSDEDFRLRYGGTSKPNNPDGIRKHTRSVLGFEKTNHETLIIFQNGKVVAAASLFDPNQCELSSKGKNTGVTEMSVTVASTHQGKKNGIGIGKETGQGISPSFDRTRSRRSGGTRKYPPLHKH